MNAAFNKDLQGQLDQLVKIISLQTYLSEVFTICNKEFAHYYVGAGCITQTVWNYLSGNKLEYGIGDIDIVYFDNRDLRAETEDAVEKKLASHLKGIPFKLDVKNEARVHLWYKEKFGFPIRPYESIEDAINTWPTTATSIGMRQDKEGNFSVYAPYGLNDLFGMTVRANKTQVTKNVYVKKAMKWKELWPSLTIIPWD